MPAAHADRNLIHLENTDVEAGIDASGEDVQASQRHTFSIEQPGSRPGGQTCSACMLFV
jgi:hypothetical protein